MDTYIIRKCECSQPGSGWHLGPVWAQNCSMLVTVIINEDHKCPSWSFRMTFQQTGWLLRETNIFRFCWLLCATGQVPVIGKGDSCYSKPSLGNQAPSIWDTRLPATANLRQPGLLRVWSANWAPWDTRLSGAPTSGLEAYAIACLPLPIAG